MIPGRENAADWEVGIAAQGIAACPMDTEMCRRACVVEGRD